MSANLTLQFLRAEKAYRSARTPQEELECLQTMLVELPKHKGTDKMQADLKQKISKVKKQLASAPKPGSKQSVLRIPRQGAGRAVIIGGPNSGKSQLVASLTRAKPLVAEYPFSTREPSPGMMPWQDVYVQLIDTPPITFDNFGADVQSLIRGAQLIVLMLDLGSDEGGEQLVELLDRMQDSKTRLSRSSYLNREDIGVTYTQTIFVPNKIDLPESADRCEFFREMVAVDFDEFPVSAAAGTGLEELRDSIYQAMDVVRVYTKMPTEKEPDMEKPYTVRRGGTLIEVAEMIHRDVAANLKSARVWGEDVHPGTSVNRDYVLKDKDIIELHI
jgi:ribosome-interacting GTPase 1